MSENILVTYDSGYGATWVTADIIAKTLAEKGLSVDLHPIGLFDLSAYDTMFIGSPIRLGRCTPKISRFLKANHSVLAEKKVAIFFTCMCVNKDNFMQNFPVYVDSSFSHHEKAPARIKLMEKNHTVSYYLKHFLLLLTDVTPLGIAFFNGRLNFQKLSPIHRFIMAFAMFSLPEIKEGDFLSPVAIRYWSNSIADELHQSSKSKWNRRENR